MTKETVFKLYSVKPKNEDRCKLEEAKPDGICIDKWLEKCPHKDDFGYTICSENCEYSYQKETYPTITSDMVLELEAVVINSVWKFGADRLLYTIEDKTHKYFAEDYSDKICVTGKTKEEALIKLLLNHYAVPRDCVKQQVKKILEGGSCE